MFDELMKNVDWEALHKQRCALIEQNFQRPKLKCFNEIEAMIALTGLMLDTAREAGLVRFNEENQPVNTTIVCFAINDHEIIPC